MSLVLLSVSSLGWVAWLHALASGPEAYLRFMEWLAFWPVTLFLMGVAQAFFYHLCMECCHFIWDTGRGFEISSGVRLAVGAAILSLILNLVFWILIWIQ
jgi:succinate dehydrogenase / fumarate reductase cytochrome b subunit